MFEIFLLVVFVVIYFLPALIAGKRDHKNAGPIFVTNLVFGWTGLGWIISLIWSLTSNTHERNYYHG